MKLLLFSDVHGNLDQCRQLADTAQRESVDLVIGAGDFGNLRRGLEKTIRALKAITQPTFVVPGNSESDAELQDACRLWPAATMLHGSGVTVDQVDIWGVGGGIPVTPFGAWSYDFTEAQAEQLLASCPRGAILITHSPPKGAVDADSRGAVAL